MLNKILYFLLLLSGMLFVLKHLRGTENIFNVAVNLRSERFSTPRLGGMEGCSAGLTTKLDKTKKIASFGDKITGHGQCVEHGEIIFTLTPKFIKPIEKTYLAEVQFEHSGKLEVFDAPANARLLFRISYPGGATDIAGTVIPNSFEDEIDETITTGSLDLPGAGNATKLTKYFKFRVPANSTSPITFRVLAIGTVNVGQAAGGAANDTGSARAKAVLSFISLDISDA